MTSHLCDQSWLADCTRPASLSLAASYTRLQDKTSTRAAQLILSIGDDHHLLHTRELVLRSAGHLVLSISSGMLADLDLEHCDGVVICHTVVLDREHVLAVVRTRFPAAALLLLQRLDMRLRDTSACTVQPLPELMLATLQKLLDATPVHFTPASTSRWH